MNVLLFVDFTSDLPEEFITFMNTKLPECCNITCHDKLDFNRWDITLRSSNKVSRTIKLYEKSYGSLNNYFKFEPIKDNGFIILDTKTNKEFWETNKKV